MAMYQPRNPETERKHRKEMNLQVWLPMGAGALLILGLMFGAWLLRPGTAGRWSEIAQIWLIIPTCFFSLISLVVFGGMAYGLIKLIAILPYQFYRLHGLVIKIQGGVEKFGDKVTAPFIGLKTKQASLDALRGRPRRRRER
jgi:hypothetical protein